MKKIISIGTLATVGSLAFAGTALAQNATSSIDTQQVDQALQNLNNSAAAAAASGTGLVALGIGMIIFWIIFGVGGFILWLWALIDVLRRTFKNPNDKIMWIVLIIIIPWIGSIIYLAAGRKNGTLPAASSGGSSAAPAAPTEKKE